MSEVKYFTDRCAAQYKNSKSLCDVCQHWKHILASSNFFCKKSHKSPSINDNVKLSTVSETVHCPHTLNSNNNRYVDTLHWKILKHFVSFSSELICWAAISNAAPISAILCYQSVSAAVKRSGNLILELGEITDLGKDAQFMMFMRYCANKDYTEWEKFFFCHQLAKNTIGEERNVLSRFLYDRTDFLDSLCVCLCWWCSTHDKNQNCFISWW